MPGTACLVQHAPAWDNINLPSTLHPDTCTCMHVSSVPTDATATATAPTVCPAMCHHFLLLRLLLTCSELAVNTLTDLL